MSKTDRWPNANRSGYRRIPSDKLTKGGKLVAYILEDMVCAKAQYAWRVVEPIGIEPMT